MNVTDKQTVVYRGVRIERIAGSTTWGFRVGGRLMGRESLEEAKREIDRKIGGGK